jgi:protein phosphatase
MEFEISGLTDIGRRKQKNEDNFGVFPAGENSPEWSSDGVLLVVADGLGGHFGGEMASKLAVSLVGDLLKDVRSGEPAASAREGEPAAPQGFPGWEDTKDWHALLREAFRRANDSIFQTNQDFVETGRPMGTTLLAAFVKHDTAWVCNVGDSRAYHVRSGEILAKTEDHSWVDEQVKQGLMTPEDAARDKRKNLVTRSIGTDPEVEADVYTWKVRSGDLVMLCSDGLINMVPDDEIAAILARPESAETLARELVDLANGNGGRDNITAIVAFVRPNAAGRALRRLGERASGVSPLHAAALIAYGLCAAAAGYLLRALGM